MCTADADTMPFSTAPSGTVAQHVRPPLRRGGCKASRWSNVVVLLAIAGFVLASGQVGASTPGASASATEAAPAPRNTKFKPVKTGAGGFVTGISFSDDGETRVIRTDGFGGYRWANGAWRLNVSSSSLPRADVEPGLGSGVLATAVAPSLSSRVYMAFDHGLFRSDDGSKTWRKVLAGPSTAPNDDFRTWGSRLAVDPVDPDVVFYGTQLDGLVVSRDGGDSWERSTTVPPGDVVDVTDPETRGSVRRPTNVLEKGRGLAGAGVSAVAIDRSTTGSSPRGARRSEVVYAASYGQGVHRSTDGGGTFVRISPPEIAAVSYMRVLTNGDLLVTSHRDPTDTKGIADVWRFDGGSWSMTGPTHEANWRSLAADPGTPGLVALMAPGGLLALSADDGLTWSSPRRTQTSAGDVPWLGWALNEGRFSYMSNGELAFDPVVPGRLWLTEGTGVWFADVEVGAAQVLWQSQSRGIEQLVPTGVIAPPGNKPLMTAWDRPIFRATKLTKYATSYGPTNEFSSAWSLDWSVTDPAYAVASVQSHQGGGQPSQSGFTTDNGRTWQPFASLPVPSDNEGTSFGFGAMAVSRPGNVVWVSANGHRPQFTVDGGDTWQPIELPGIEDYSLISSKPHFVSREIVAADKTMPGTFYLYAWGVGIFRSSDGARSWDQVSDDIAENPHQYAWNVTLKAAPAKEGHLFVTPGQLSGTTSQSFRRSMDGGRTWSDVEGITGVTAFGFGKAFEGSDYPAIYLAGYRDGVYGIYRSIDEAQTWTYLTDYPTGRTPTVVAIDGDKDVRGRFYLAIGGSGWVYGQLR